MTYQQVPPGDLLVNERTFRIHSLNEAEDFEKFLNQYYKTSCDGKINEVIPENYIKILYSYCQEHYANGRLFNAIVDLEITYLFMMKDCFSSGAIWNQLFSKDESAGGSVLEDFDKFAGKMDILYAFTAFAFRCRSYWDKYMGILILLYDGKKYDDYCKARSRKKSFMNIAKNWSVFSPYIQKGLTQIVCNLRIHAGQKDEMTEHLKNHDISFPSPFLEIMNWLIKTLDSVRTAEAHGTGALRKWSLSMLPLSESKDSALYNHWNNANVFMQTLRETIIERQTYQGRIK